MKQLKNYNPTQTYFITFNPLDFFKPTSLEMTIHNAVEKLSIKPFLGKMNNQKRGCKSYSPKLLLKILFYSYATGVFSSRKMEKNMSNNLSYIFLSNYNIIDHSIICRFINKFDEEIQQIFSKVLYICYKNKLITLDMAAVDGTKMRANAHSQWTGNKKEFLKLKERLQKRIKKLIERQKRNDDVFKNEKQKESLNRKIERQTNQCKRMKEKIDNFLSNLDDKDEKLKVNLVDSDSKRQRGENGKYFDGYNLQVLSNQEFIISQDTSNHQSDRQELLPMVNKTEDTLKHVGFNDKEVKQLKILADAGYRNNDHIGKLKNRGYDLYVRVDPKKLSKENDSVTVKDCKILKKNNQKFLVCPGKRVLETKRISKSHGYDFYNFFASRGGCTSCKLFDKCWGKSKVSSKKFTMKKEVYDNYCTYKSIKHKLETTEGRDIYNQRIGMVERVFGQIKGNMGFKKFHHRGLKKVSTIWSIMCTSYNLMKIHNLGVEI